MATQPTTPRKPSTRKPRTSGTSGPATGQRQGTRRAAPVFNWILMAWANIATAFTPLGERVAVAHWLFLAVGALLVVATVAVMRGRIRKEWRAARNGQR